MIKEFGYIKKTIKLIAKKQKVNSKENEKRTEKASSRRLQDVLVKTNIFALVILLQKTSSRRFQDVFKTCCKDILKTFSRRPSNKLFA